VIVVGFDANGVQIREEVTLTGTTEANTTNSFTTLKRIVKLQTAGNVFNGNVEIQDTSNNTLARIPIWIDSPDYQWVEFDPIPDAAITYTVRGEATTVPLVDDDDWPEIPLEFMDMLVSGPIMVLFPQLGLDSLAQTHRDSFEVRLDELLDSQGDSNMLPMASLTFANVHAETGPRDRPLRPQIQGVDFA
jgi:hypothetical protein